MTARPSFLPATFAARAWSALCALMLPAYALVFRLDMGSPSGANILNALISVTTLLLLGLAAMPVLRSLLSREGKSWATYAWVAVVLLVFAFGWYVALASTYGWVNSGFRGGGAIPSFSGPAFRWQILQGLMAAGALVAIVDAERARCAAAKAVNRSEEEPGRPAAMLLRDGDELVRIERGDIVSISAHAEDVIVNLGNRRITVRRSLKDFESELDGSFLRIHRATIVNLDKVVRIEPAGAGRLTVHLSDGSAPIASKTGSRRLKAIAA